MMRFKQWFKSAILIKLLIVAVLAAGAFPLFAEEKGDEKEADPVSRMTPIPDEVMSNIEGRSRHSAGMAVTQVHTNDVIRQIQVENNDAYRQGHANQTRRIRVDRDLPQADHDDRLDELRNQ